MEFRSAISRTLQLDDSDYSRFLRKGETDGKKNIPSAKTRTLGAYEKSIIAKKKSEWQKYDRGFNKEITTLETKIDENRHSIETAISNEIEDLSVEQQAEEENIENELGSSSAKFNYLETKLSEVSDDLSHIKSLLKRPLEIKYVQVYIPLLIALSITEIPVNQSAFQLFFGSQPGISYILAFAIGIMFVFFAHVCGDYVKRAQCPELNPPVVRIYSFVGAITLVTGVLVYALAIMRQELVRNSAEIDFGDLLDTDVPSTVNNIVSSMGDLSPDRLESEGFTLLLFNVLVLLCGGIASFLRHDSHPNYEKLQNLRDKSEKEFFKHKELYQKTLSDLSKIYTDKVKSLRSKQRAEEKDNNIKLRELDNLTKVKNEDKKAFINAISNIINSYHEGNLEKRNDEKPVYFDYNLKDLIEKELGI